MLLGILSDNSTFLAGQKHWNISYTNVHQGTITTNVPGIGNKWKFQVKDSGNKSEFPRKISISPL